MADRPSEPEQHDGRLIPVDPELALSDVGEPLETPIGTAVLFLQALADPQQYDELLHVLSTPESREAWGDFTAAASQLADLGHWSIQTRGERPEPDVAQIGILRPLKFDAYYVEGESVQVEALATITLVNRPARGGWLVHQIGAPCDPGVVPRDP